MTLKVKISFNYGTIATFLAYLSFIYTMQEKEHNGRNEELTLLETF